MLEYVEQSHRLFAADEEKVLATDGAQISTDEIN
jgi:hypothetical protein